ncbi:transposase, partial [Teladorsagia circumcincta]
KKKVSEYAKTQKYNNALVEVGDYTLEDEERSGRPSELNLSELRRVVKTNPSQSTWKLASTLGVHSSTIASGLKKLGMKKKLGRYEPHYLEPVDRDRRVDACLILLNLHKGNRWLEHLFTGDEKWIYYNNLHRKAQWVSLGETPKKVPKDVHPKKVMLSIWWDVRGPVLWQLLDEGATATAILYTQQLRDLKRIVDQRGKSLRTRAQAETELTSYFASRQPAFWWDGIYKLPER